MSARPRALVFALLGLVAVSSLGACTTYRDELTRAQSAYDANDHDAALALSRAIAPNVAELRPAEQTRYYYLRGMASFRVGFRAEARHYLAVARAMEAESSGALPTDWKNRMEETLSTLNTDVYTNGLESLASAEDEAAHRKAKKK